jgi:hypothetical protein
LPLQYCASGWQCKARRNRVFGFAQDVQHSTGLLTLGHRRIKSRNFPKALSAKGEMLLLTRRSKNVSGVGIRAAFEFDHWPTAKIERQQLNPPTYQ